MFGFKKISKKFFYSPLIVSFSPLYFNLIFFSDFQALYMKNHVIYFDREIYNRMGDNIFGKIV